MEYFIILTRGAFKYLIFFYLVIENYLRVSSQNHFILKNSCVGNKNFIQYVGMMLFVDVMGDFAFFFIMGILALRSWQIIIGRL